jgi:diguanylate cyclase (GGDEF)-like protein
MPDTPTTQNALADRGQGETATIAELSANLEAQAAVIRDQAAALAHSRKIFDRASAAARIGVWECDLPSTTLRWTDVVYDIFDLPRGSALDRQQILTWYTPDSVHELHLRRSRAIEERGGFSLDAEIVTPKGNRRWIRITATVECEDGEPVRIFGMKQDITEEKILADRTRYLAEFDVMTGLANRSQFQSKLSALGENEAGARGALMLIDLDAFKDVNDTFGHAAGDECLKEAAQRLRDVCEGAELIARIGGDEFAVLLAPQVDQGALAVLARDVVDALGRPVDHGGTLLRLGASVGVARFEAGIPGQSFTPAQLFMNADAALYAAKAAGRNTFRIFSTDTRLSPPRAS